jgi:uncharacterized membrane protein
MASKVSNSIVIERQVEEVFAFVDDYKNVVRYLVGMTEYRPLTDQTSGKGSKFALVKKTPGLPDIKSKVEITDWQPGRRIAFESYDGFDNGGAYAFEPASGGTRVTLTNTYDLTSLLGGGGGFLGGLKKAAGGVASRAAEGTVMKDLEKSLANLKKLVEGAPSRAGAVKAPAAPPAPKPAPKPAAEAAAKPAAKKPAAKPAAKKAAAKPTAKKAVTRPATKKATAKPAAKKTAAKPAAKKTAAKPVAKKSTAKPAAKKAAAKPAAKKAAAKPAARKATAKPAAKRPTAKKSSAR